MQFCNQFICSAHSRAITMHVIARFGVDVAHPPAEHVAQASLGHLAMTPGEFCGRDQRTGCPAANSLFLQHLQRRRRTPRTQATNPEDPGDEPRGPRRRTPRTQATNPEDSDKTPRKLCALSRPIHAHVKISRISHQDQEGRGQVQWTPFNRAAADVQCCKKRMGLISRAPPKKHNLSPWV